MLNIEHKVVQSQESERGLFLSCTNYITTKSRFVFSVSRSDFWCSFSLLLISVWYNENSKPFTQQKQNQWESLNIYVSSK